VTDLTGPRLSQLSRCPRQAAYGALDTPEDPTPVPMAVYWRRGHVYQRLRFEEYAAEHGRDNVEFERPIPWPLGEGHADIYVKPTKTIVELVSTVAPSHNMLALKFQQAKCYLHFDPEAERAVVEAINPSRLEPAETFPVRVSDEDAAEIDAAVAAVQHAIESGGDRMPERVCEKPSDARQHLCPFATTCFAGWTAPAPVPLDDPAAVQAAVDAYKARVKRDEAKAILKDADQDWQDAVGVLAEYVPAGKHTVGGLTVARTSVKARETFSFANARKAGALAEPELERLSAFVKVGEPHERWTIERNGEPLDDAAADDFGDVPF
jgi:hypothetical protein